MVSASALSLTDSFAEGCPSSLLFRLPIVLVQMMGEKLFCISASSAITKNIK